MGRIKIERGYGEWVQCPIINAEVDLTRNCLGNHCVNYHGVEGEFLICEHKFSGQRPSAFSE